MIIVPAAGEGRRFREAGYSRPKHELLLGGRPMVDWVLENCRTLDPRGWRCVADQTVTGGPTRGAVDTIVRGYDWLVAHSTTSSMYDPWSEKLVVANCDQLLALPSLDELGQWGNGIVFTFKSANPAHSYVTTERDLITTIVEKPKNPPSDRAVSGVYAFPQSGPFIEACREVLREGHAVSAGAPELYVSTALARMIDRGYSLFAVDVPTAILGTPEDFQRFETAATVLKALP